MKEKFLYASACLPLLAPAHLKAADSDGLSRPNVIILCG